MKGLQSMKEKSTQEQSKEEFRNTTKTNFKNLKRFQSMKQLQEEENRSPSSIVHDGK